MAKNRSGNTWQENLEDVIMLVNHSEQNFILELPSGRYRLDAGRRMRTMNSILDIAQIKSLVDQGQLAVEN